MLVRMAYPARGRAMALRLMKAPILLAFLALAAAEPTGTLTLACQAVPTTTDQPDV